MNRPGNLLGPLGKKGSSIVQRPRAKSAFAVTEYVIVMMSCLVGISILLSVALPGDESLLSIMGKSLAEYMARVSIVLSVP